MCLSYPVIVDTAAYATDFRPKMQKCSWEKTLPTFGPWILIFWKAVAYFAFIFVIYYIIMQIIMSLLNKNK